MEGQAVMAKTVIDDGQRSVWGGPLGALDLVRELGSGASGTVFEAIEPKTQKHYIVKALRPEVRTPNDLIRFSREARLLQRLKHPNVVPIVHVATNHEPPYFVMPMRPGRTVAALIEKGPLPEATVIRMARDVCFALAEVHRHGIVHRDVKPANLLQTDDGRTMLIDFGLARVVAGTDGGITAQGAVLGTPGYMSPEQCLGEPATCKADVYSLGVTIMELVLGTNPFSAPTLLETLKRQIELAPRRLDAMLPGRVNEELAELVHRMLAKEPSQRPSAERSLETFAGLVRAQELKARALGAAAETGKKDTRRVTC
jgi:serine/threonine-protein kinase